MKVNDIVVEVETAKSLVELPVPFAGLVTELHVNEGRHGRGRHPDHLGGDGAGRTDDGQGRTGSGAVEPGIEGSPAPKVDPSVTGVAEEEIEEGKIGGTTSTGRTAVLVGYGVKQTEAKRRPRKADAAPAERFPLHNPDEFVPSTEVALGDRTARAPRAAQPVVSRDPGAGRVLAKPPVRKLAKDLGVDLARSTASGDGGIITRADVEAHVSGAPTDGVAAPVARAVRRAQLRGARSRSRASAR